MTAPDRASSRGTANDCPDLVSELLPLTVSLIEWPLMTVAGCASAKASADDCGWLCLSQGGR